MRRILEKAQELAEELLASEEFRAYQEAEIELLNDEEVQGLLARLSRLEERLRRLDYATKEEGQQLAEEARRLRAEIQQHPAYLRFLKARQAFDRLVGLVMDAISFGLTGMERQAAGCGSGGCGCAGLVLPPSLRRPAAPA